MSLSRRTLALYAMPVAGLTAMHWLVLMYLLKFSTDVLGISAAVMGSLFAAARAWDAISDPLIGWWSDRTRTALGRRRPWMFAAALPLGLSYFALWSPPVDVSPTMVVVWVAAFLWLFYTTQTCFSIPHISLGAELSADPHERTRVSGARVAADIFGIVPAIAVLHWLETSGSTRDVATLAATGIGCTTALLILYGSLRVEEPREHQDAPVAANPFRALADVARNPHAVRITIALLLCELGMGSLLVAIPYIGEVTGQPGESASMLIRFIVPFALTILPWIVFARRIGKLRAWVISCVVTAVSFSVMGFASSFALWLVPFVTIGIGVGQAGMKILGPSVKADVIDWDEARTGERKEGTYFAAWNLVDKLGGALSVAIVGFAIDAPGGGIDPQGVKFVTSVLPAGFTFAAVFVLLRFRLDARAHAEVRREIVARGQRTRPGRPGPQGVQPVGHPAVAVRRASV
jgi:GPH family glycoside/pentoside/hexuronide:cation symporter